jgi:Ca2+-transporting ATPase
MADSGTPKATVAFAWHAHTIDECLHAAELESSETGLTAAEAEKRLKDHGKNAMTPPERPSFLRKLWGQINSALIWILIAAAIISGAQQEWVELGLILGFVGWTFFSPLLPLCLFAPLSFFS